MAGWAIVGATAIAAVAVTYGMVESANSAAAAQKEVAQTNAKATVDAAKEAAHAQIESAKQDAGARMHEADVAHQQEQEYLQFEKWAMAHEDDMDSYYRSVQGQIDEIDQFYADDSSWGAGTANSYDYGNGGYGTISADEMQFS